MPPHLPATRIQLMFNTKTTVDVRKYYTTLYRWQRMVHKAANLILSHKFFMLQLKDMVYLNEHIKLHLSNASKDEHGMLITSKQNATYLLLSKRFRGNIPTSILTALNNEVVRIFNKERADYYTGRLVLRSYPSDIPIPINPNDLTDIFPQTHKYRGNEYSGYNFMLHGIPLKAIFSHDSQALPLWDGMLKGSYKLFSPEIELRDKKIFLNGFFVKSKRRAAL